MTQARKTISWIFLIVVVVAAARLVLRPATHPGPLHVSFWYWHSPYQLTSNDQKELREIGVSQMFVRAGTFTQDGKHVLLRLPQEYGSGASAFPVHLVFNADGGMVHHFGDFSVQQMAEEMTPRLMLQLKRAESAGLNVQGVQLDIDCPTRLLPRYAALIRMIRSREPRLRRGSGLQFSTTGLWSWLQSHEVVALSRELDFMVPQAYEGLTGKSVDTMRTVSDPDSLRAGLPLAERLACPYWIGVPTYGHALVFDDQGAMLGVYHRLSAGDALRQSTFVQQQAFGADRLGRPASNPADWVGEEILKLKATQADRFGRGKGYSLCYTIPTPEMVTKWAAILGSRGSGCQGVIVYRMPDAGSPMALSLNAVRQALEGRTSPSLVEVRTQVQSDPFARIEGRAKVIPVDLMVEMQNAGGVPAFFATDAVKLTVHFSRPCVDSAVARDMDSAVTGSADGQGGVVSGPRTLADTVVFTRSSLLPGEKVFAGPIQLTSSQSLQARIEWEVRDLTTLGGTVRGSLDVPLRSKGS